MLHKENLDMSRNNANSGNSVMPQRAPRPTMRGGEVTLLPSAVRLTALGLLLIGTMCLPLALTAQKLVSHKPTEDLPPGAMQAYATTACLECHEARIILQQRLSKATWTKEVDKMSKWGAVVDASDHDALIDYLAANFDPKRPPYEPPRSSLGKAGRRKLE